MEQQIAILIDGDNISSKYAEYIKQEALQYGNIKFCRMYGSVTSPSVKGWYKVLPAQGITPVLQINYANGKSIADQALTIDAMDLLYTGNIDIFCIVSSDSDFTKLAYRLKEAGKRVIGMGEQKTKEALAKACNEFKILDLIYKTGVEGSEEEEKILEAAAAQETQELPEIQEEEPVEPVQAELSIPKEEDIVNDILGMLEEDEWVNLANVGFQLSQKRPGFDSRNYGYKSMSMLIKKHENVFETNKEKAPDNIHNVLFIRKRAHAARPKKKNQRTNTQNKGRQQRQKRS